MEPVVTVVTTLPENPSRKQRTAMRTAFKTAAEHHWQRNLPKHFEPGAASRYGYRKRSSRWQAIKKELTGSSLPLRFTGQLQRDIVDRRPRITTTSTNGARMYLKASLPGFSGRFAEGGLKSWKRIGGVNYAIAIITELNKRQEQQLHRIEEVKAVTAEELEQLARICERTFVEEFEAAKAPRRLV